MASRSLLQQSRDATRRLGGPQKGGNLLHIQEEGSNRPDRAAMGRGLGEGLGRHPSRWDNPPGTP
jgi:hypothetical protein